MSNNFIPKLWADEIMRGITARTDFDILWGLWKDTIMRIDPELESFFVAVSLLHGTHPEPQFGIERVTLAQGIAEFISGYPGHPDVLERVRRNYVELGGRLLAVEKKWFYEKLADAYLDWLYSQPESQNLLPAALDRIEKLRELTTAQQSPWEKKKSLRTIKW